MATTLEILSYVVALLVALYYYFTAKFNFWRDRSVPGPKPIPVFGNIFWPMMGKQSLAEFLTDLYREYKNEPLVGIFVRRTPHLVVQDPDLIKDVLIKDFQTFANRGFMLSEVVRWPYVPTGVDPSTIKNHVYSSWICLQAK